MVIGLKRPALLERAPVDVTIVEIDSVDQLRATAGTSRVAAASDGLSLTSLGPGRNRMFLRGVADSALNGESQSTVAVVFDGARLTYSAPDPDLRLVDIERVELLKGPQGSLYGSGTLGGIYNIVSHAPDLDAASVVTSASLDATAGGDIRSGGTMIVNLPLGRGSAALRLVGYGAETPGWIDTGQRQNSNRSQVFGTRASFMVDLGGDWQVDLGGLAQWLGNGDSQYVYRLGSRSRPAQLAEPHDNDLQHLSVRLKGSTALGEMTVQSGLTLHEVRDTLDATVGAESFGLGLPERLENARRYRVWDNEVRLTNPVGQGSWQIGLSHVAARQSERATLFASDDASLVVDNDYRVTQETALFGDFSLPIGNDLTVDAGARLFRSTVLESRIIGDAEVIADQHHFGLTPSIAIGWQPDQGHLAWLRYASAIRPGGSDIDPTGMLDVLESDELQSLEAGWRGNDIAGGRLEFAAYGSQWSHIQSDILKPNGLVETINAGNGRMIGFEGSWNRSFDGGWHLTLGASYTNARLVRTTLPFEIDDNSLPVVPRYSARARIEHSLSWRSTDVTAGLTLRYVGPSHLSFDPSVDRTMGNLIESRVDCVLRNRDWLAAIAVENFLGQSSNAFAYGNPFRFRTMRQYTPQSPTTVTVTVSRRF